MRLISPKDRIYVPPPRARLPRDHFAMQPHLSFGQRLMRALTVLAVLAYGCWWLWVR